MKGIMVALLLPPLPIFALGEVSFSLPFAFFLSLNKSNLFYNFFFFFFAARAELGEFVEYDLDNEDEDWLHDFYKKDRKNLSPEK
jgi:hypothetical protein